MNHNIPLSFFYKNYLLSNMAYVTINYFTKAYSTSFSITKLIPMAVKSRYSYKIDKEKTPLRVPNYKKTRFTTTFFKKQDRLKHNLN